MSEHIPTPKPDLTTPVNCIRWALALIPATERPVTLRNAKRMLRPRDSIATHEFQKVLDELVEEGEIKLYDDPHRTVGRPAIYLHPAVIYKFVLHSNLIEPSPTHYRAPLHPSYLPLTPHDPSPTSGPVTLPEPQPEHETSSPPTPEPEVPDLPPLLTYEETDEEPALDPSYGEPESPTQAATPEQLEQETSQDPAFALMHQLAAKSVKDRKYGVTDDELLWVLHKHDYADPHASELVKAFTTGAPHYMRGGLLLTLPKGVHNKTPQNRYIPRSDGQALTPDLADFEAAKRAQVTH